MNELDFASQTYSDFQRFNILDRRLEAIEKRVNQHIELTSPVEASLEKRIKALENLLRHSRHALNAALLAIEDDKVDEDTNEHYATHYINGLLDDIAEILGEARL